MKKMLLAGAAAGAVVSFAGVANAQLSTGFIGLGYTDFDFLSTITVDGTFSHDLTDSIETQVGGNIAFADFDGGTQTTLWGLDIHVFADMDKFKVGGFAAYEDFDGSELSGLGVEGRYAVSDDITVGAAAGWGNVGLQGFVGSLGVDAYRAEGSYFINDHLRLDASYSVTSFDVSHSSNSCTSSSNHTNHTTIALGGEYQVEDAPVSLFGKVEVIRGYLFDTCVSGNTESMDPAVTVGMRRTFGGSLRDRDRTSAPFGNATENFGGSGTAFLGSLLGLEAFFGDIED